MKKKWVWLVFAVYSLLMLWLLFGQRLGMSGSMRANLKPFETIRRFLWVLENSDSPGLIHHAVVNLAGNVIMFVPLGVLLPEIWCFLRRFWVYLVTAFGVILAVEILQLFTGLGACDVDDLLLNAAGALIGYGIWALFFVRKDKA